jgi:nucleoside-diphosphate-sugar epimerase
LAGSEAPADMTRILCTGGAGYIGTTLAPLLLEARHHVTVLDRFPQGMPFLAACCANPRFDVVRGDIRDWSTVGPLVARHDVVINLAALVGAPICAAHPFDAESINREAVKHLAAGMSPDQLLLQPTSDSGYGVGYQANVCTEDHPLNPTSLYARSKVEAEKHVLGVGGVSFRLASVFGMSPRMRLDLIANEFVWRAVTDRSVVLFEGHFRRNFVHVRDVCAAFIRAIDAPDGMRGKAFNCGATSEMMTKRQLCERIAKQVPFEWFESETGFDPDRRDFVVANDRLEATGWVARYSVDDGIAELVRGYRMLSKGGFFNA